ncbi:phage head-tail connector protein (plasmid) [Staphylococcus aureus]|uniref:phage head-tail connector protein n=1 Tax=Staphylococcus aureus TaxID=1280 RepID=UPI0021D33122|nr:phage head-tail connector protein [Staphylococcus aureus]UXV54397.1 phage head-tail connector protein [Staphylococcus aureus]UXV57109.1 phage head-tail connector protein [Staphylococcus aureus]
MLKEIYAKQLKQIKLINQINTDEHDDDLLQLIDLYKEVAEEYCNNDFTVDMPSSVVKFIAECIKLGASSNIASRSMGSVSYTYVTELPKSTYKHILPFRKLRW